MSVLLLAGCQLVPVAAADISANSSILQASQISQACRDLVFVSTGLPNNAITDVILRRLYRALGYRVNEVVADSSAEAYELLSEGEADVYTNTWVPLDKADLEPFALQGKVKTIQHYLTGGFIGLATNDDGHRLGLERFEQLSQFRQALNNTIYVNRLDWAFAQTMQRIIDRNIYGLGGFDVRRIHDFDFEEMLKQAEEHHQPVAFFARAPSQMATHHRPYFLQDSKAFFTDFQAPADVYTSLRYAFPDSCPEAMPLLRRVKITVAMVQHIIKQTDEQGISLEQATLKWMKANRPVVDSWLQGLRHLDGSPVVIDF